MKIGGAYIIMCTLIGLNLLFLKVRHVIKGKLEKE